MRHVIRILCLALAAPALAQDSGRPVFDIEQLRANLEFNRIVYARAEKVRPRRRDEPLRELNITDEEIRQIQDATRSFLERPDAYLNIGPVVTGCPCEEGSGCTDQVYVLAEAGADAVGLQLSRVHDEWTVGIVQRWWLDYQRLRAKQPRLNWSEYELARGELAQRFPVCSGPDQLYDLTVDTREN